jgi:hypothetical protein
LKYYWLVNTLIAGILVLFGYTLLGEVNNIKLFAVFLIIIGTITMTNTINRIVKEE